MTAASNNGGGWLPIGFNQVCDQAAADYASCMSTPKPIDSAVLSSFLDWLGTVRRPGRRWRRCGR